MAPSNLKTKLLLLIERETGELLKFSLSARGFEVMAFPVEAIIELPAEALVFKPDLAIIQRHMGRGLRLCRAIRDDPAWGNIRILLISANGASGEKEARAAGADAYLKLPFHFPEIHLRIQRLLRN